MNSKKTTLSCCVRPKL